MDEQKRSSAKPLHFTESAEGYQQFQAALMNLAENHSGVHFHIRLDTENRLLCLHHLPFNTSISPVVI